MHMLNDTHECQGGIRKVSLLIVILAVSISPAFSATQRAATLLDIQKTPFYNTGAGATLGKIYTPTSPAIDVRNIMGSTWYLNSGNNMPEKYILNKPYPYSYDIYKHVKLTASEYGIAALIDNGFEQQGLVYIQQHDVGYHPQRKIIMNIYGNVLINFYTSPIQAIDNKHDDKILVTAQNIKNVLDNTVNMHGIAQADFAVMRNGHLVLMAKAELKKQMYKVKYSRPVPVVMKQQSRRLNHPVYALNYRYKKALSMNLAFVSFAGNTENRHEFIQGGPPHPFLPPQYGGKGLSKLT